MRNLPGAPVRSPRWIFVTIRFAVKNLERAIVASALLCSTLPLAAEVKLVVRNGKKTIVNVGAGGKRSGGGTDYNWLAKQRNRSSDYDEIIERNARAFSIDPILVKAVIQVESNFDPACVSHKGAQGLMQLMPDTAKRFNVSKLFDPEQNIRGGVAYLSYLISYFSNDLPRAIAAYNAGENAVNRHGGIPPYAETQEYVTRTLTVYYGKPYHATGATWIAGRAGSLKGGLFQESAGRATIVASALVPAGNWSVRFLNTK